MTRKKRLKQCRFWRKFISDVNQQHSQESITNLLRKLSCIELIQVEHGWTTWVTVRLEDGEEFLEKGSFAVDSLIQIGRSIYKYSVGQYLDYIKSINH